MDSICSIGYCGTSYGADISFDVWRRFGFSSRLFPETKSFATSCVTLLTGIPSWHPVTDLRAPTSNPDGLSLPIRAQIKNYYHIEHLSFMFQPFIVQVILNIFYKILALEKHYHS